MWTGGRQAGATRWSVVACAGLAVFMAQLDTTVVNVALPTMRADFGVSAGSIAWVVLAYLIPLVALSLLCGRWLDQGGRRAAATAAAAGFGVASAAVAAAPNLVGVAAARFIQGAFGAGLLALAPVLAVEAVPPSARARSLGVVAGLAPLGAMAGPTLGGLLVDAFGWRSAFLLNVPVSAVVVLLARRGLHDRSPLGRPAIAWVGEAALIAAAAGAALTGLSLGAGHGLAWLALIAAASIPLVVWRAERFSEPVRRLIRQRGMVAPHVALFTSYVGMLAAQFAVPFFMQQQLQASAGTVGVTLLAYPIGTAVLSPLGGALADRVGARRVAVTGAVLLTAGLALLAPLDPSWSATAVGWRLAVVGGGFGLLATPTQRAALDRAGATRRGTAAATTNLARQAGLAFGPALVTLAWGLDGYRPAGLRAGLLAATAVAALAVAASAALSTDPLDEKEEDYAMSLKVAVIYYSATGNVHALARAVAEGAEKEGAEVRLRRVAELAPQSAIDANPAWRRHVEDTKDVPVAELDDLVWADAYAFGSPTRFGNVASQLKQYVDMTGPLWASGQLSNKAVTAFTSAINAHGGNETTLTALYNTMYHWGAIIVPPGYTDGVVSAAGGNPYGTAHPSGSGAPGDETLAAAVYQGRRLAQFGSAIAGVRQAAA